MKLTDDQLNSLQRLANAKGENLPPSDDYFTLMEWKKILSDQGLHIGTHKLRGMLNECSHIYNGTVMSPSGRPNSQVWYQVDFAKLME